MTREEKAAPPNDQPHTMFAGGTGPFSGEKGKSSIRKEEKKKGEGEPFFLSCSGEGGGGGEGISLIIYEKGNAM